MRQAIINIMQVVMLAFLCPLLMGAHVGKPFQDSFSTTIQTNPDFPKDYYIAAGTPYEKGYPDLSYKMIDVIGQKGLFTSREQSIIYINILADANGVITGIQGLPSGLTSTQDLFRRRPQDNTFFIYGTVPVDYPEGVYPVTITGQDGARTENTATQVIYLHIVSSVPRPLQTDLQIKGKVGETPNPSDMRKYFDPKKQIDKFVINDELALPPGISFTKEGVFTGNYTKEGSYYVEIKAGNNASPLLSEPLKVTFLVSLNDSIPVPKPDFNVSKNINDPVILNELPDKEASFTLNPGASPITSCELVSGSQEILDSFGLTYTSDCSFHGGTTYSKAGFFTVQIKAKNDLNIWSAPFKVNFAISIPDSVPMPQPDLTISKNVNTPVDLNELPNREASFKLNPGASPITSCELVSGSKEILDSFGLTYNTVDCSFHGGTTYAQVGTYTVQIRAQNNLHILSDPFSIHFKILPPGDAPPSPNYPSSLNIYDRVGNPVVTDNMKTHFHKINPTDSDIIDYQLVDPIPNSDTTGIKFNTADGSFSGTYAQVGTYTFKVKAENATHIFSDPFTMNFIVSPNSTAHSVITCPTWQQVANCATEVSVSDSDGVAYKFQMKSCPGLVKDFKIAYLRSANPAYPNALSCVYIDLTDNMPNIIYVLDPVPTGTYYGNDTTQTSASCSISEAGCPFNIPH